MATFIVLTQIKKCFCNIKVHCSWAWRTFSSAKKFQLHGIHNHCNNHLCLFLSLLLKGDKLKNVEECDSMIVDCMVKLGRLDEAAKKLHTMILARPDHWLYIKTYVRCQVQRCQNFRERVKQQVERDKRNRQQQQETTENGTGSSEDSTNGDVERSRTGETEKEGESRDRGSRGSDCAEVAGGDEKNDGVSLSDGQGQGEEEDKGSGKGDNERGTGGETGDEEQEETAAGAKEITVG